MSNHFVKQGYNMIAQHYAANRERFGSTKYLKKLNSLLNPNSIILDIGCGAGIPVDSYLISKGHKILGIDISEKMIEFAKKNVPQAKYKVVDMISLKESEYSVDAVVSFYAIFHISRELHAELLRKIYSFLPKFGLILITMGSSEWEGKEKDFHGAEMFWSHYDAKKNSQLVMAAGFKILFDEIDVGANERHQILIAKKI